MIFCPSYFVWMSKLVISILFCRNSRITIWRSKFIWQTSLKFIGKISLNLLNFACPSKKRWSRARFLISIFKSKMLNKTMFLEIFFRTIKNSIKPTRSINITKKKMSLMWENSLNKTMEVSQKKMRNTNFCPKMKRISTLIISSDSRNNMTSWVKREIK